MKKLLWISLSAPYDKVDHAGGKVHNYQIKRMNSTAVFEIHLISSCYEREVKNIDLDDYGIDNKIIVMKQDLINKIIRGIKNLKSKYWPFDVTVGLMDSFLYYKFKREFLNYYYTNEQVDIIILQWTQIILFAPLIKSLFPNCKIVMIEEDVSFLLYERKKIKAEKVFEKALWSYRFKKLKSLEIESLKHADIITVTSEKDKALLIEENIPRDKIFTTVSYFDDYGKLKREKQINKDIVFYGSMRRPENYKSAIWFIENVLDALIQYDRNIRFVIIGATPHSSLQKYQSDYVKIMGFVEDVSPYFSSSLCMVAPLVMGAGIKIKILEGLSAGIPVLTNSIGIEGIPAISGKDYIFCETAKEYIESIMILINDSVLSEELSNNSKRFINEKFSYSKSVDDLIMRIKKLSD